MLSGHCSLTYETVNGYEDNMLWVVHGNLSGEIGWVTRNPSIGDVSRDGRKASVKLTNVLIGHSRWTSPIERTSMALRDIPHHPRLNLAFPWWLTVICNEGDIRAGMFSTVRMMTQMHYDMGAMEDDRGK
jgi:hypothetical protein